MAQLVNALQARDLLRSAARFVLVGMLGTLIDFSLFARLSLQLGLPALLANTLSYSAGMANNDLLHRSWTFAHRPRKAAGQQFWQFVGVSLSALALNNLVVGCLAPAFSTRFADPALGGIAAKTCALGLGLGWNFLANHLWTFRAAPDRQ